MKIRRIWIFVLLSFLFVFTGVFSSSAKTDQGGTPVVITVNDTGFADTFGQPVHHVIRIPKESLVKIVFEYHDESGDEHEFAVMMPSEEEIYSEELSKDKGRVEIEFFSGKTGERYEVYCILACAAMDNLVDLFLVVG